VGKSAYVSQVAKYLQPSLLDHKFPKKLDNTRGLFIFADGILNLRTQLFQEGFKSEDYITTTISHKYHEIKYIDKTKMDQLRLNLKQILNNNNTHLEYYLGVVGHAMTGDSHLEKSIYYIVDGTENQKGDNGKTFLFNLLSHIFPEYVRLTDPKIIEASNTKAHKQLATYSLARIIYANEGTKKKLNASLVKEIGDGLEIENEVMFGTCDMLRIMYKMFVCSNHIPTIEKDEQALYNRYKQIQLCSHFDRTGERKEVNLENLEFIADPGLADNLKSNYVNEIIGLVLQYAMKYYKSGIPVIPLEFQQAVDKTKMSNDSFALWFYAKFEKEDNAITSKYDIMTTPFEELNETEMLKEIKQLGFTYDKDMKGLGTKIMPDGKKAYIKGGFENFKRRVNVDVVEYVV
jgi:phage/plasmid-associated DNA primase